MLGVLTFLIAIKASYSSFGDYSPFYQRCLKKCEQLYCSIDGQDFMENDQPIHLRLTLWSCNDECKYNCMWKTVNEFHEKKWNTPQFHGKWPFIRILGIQEPASVLFSLLNLYIHIKMLKKFRREVRPDSPLYVLWHIFSFICCHAWFWSAIFHARDFQLTEFMDYTCAFSIILINSYVMVLRVLRTIVPRFVLIILTTFFVTFFINHAIYLSQGQFDYGYNMELNVVVGTFSALIWFAWCAYNRTKQIYVWKCAIYVALTGVVLLLELVDRPPIFYIFDYHSLWHLSTAPLVILIYSFAIDDCKYLRKKEVAIKDLDDKPKQFKIF